MADNGHWQLSSIQDVGDGERTSAPFNYSQTCIAATYIKVSILTVSLRRFFWVHTTYVLVEYYENNFQLPTL